ncbi:MAG: hypothetical protein P8M30_21335, partial [Planctomycetaceae bacterium]|nr:hypothetical protein [Planctomycetaceae bacterium]
MAEQTGEYTQYSRSMIGFEEAVTLWAGNESAKDGVERTRHAYALSAERKKDFELGLSLLDASIPDQEELVKRLTVSRDEQNTRLQHIRITKRVLLGAFGLLVISSIFILDQRQRIAVNEKELAIATIEKDAAQQQSRIEVYYRNLADAQRLIQFSQIGRSSQALSLLQESSQIKFSSRDDSDLRTKIVSCLKDGELRSAGVLANGFNASVITFKPDGAVIAVGEDRHRFVNPKLKVHLYQFPSGELLRELTCPINVKYLIQNQGIDGMRRLLWSPDGRWLVASCRRGSIHIWDTTKNYSRQSLPTESPVGCRLLFSPDSLHLYAAELSSSSNNLLRRFKLSDKSVFREVCRAEIDCSNGLEISPDASHLYTCGVQHIQTLDAQSLEVLRDRPSAISLFTQSRNGKVRFILNDRTVGLSTEDGFDIRRAIGTGNELRDRIDVKRHLACTANGSICLTQTLGPPQIQFFESADGRLFGEWPLTDPKSTGFPAQLDPTGNYAAVPDGDHVKVIEIIHSNEHNFIGLATDYVQSGALSPKEQYAVAVTQFQDNDTSLKLTVLKRESDSFWNEHQIIRPRVLSRHHVRDSHVCFHPDGSRFVVSLYHCGQISQYNIDGVMQWELPMDTPREVAFSPDGRQLWITHSTKVQRLQLRNNNIDEVWNWDNTWAGLQRGGRTLSIAVGKTLAVASDSDGRIHVFSTERPAQKNLLQRDWSTQVASHLVPVTTIKVMKNDNYILCGDEIGKIYQIDCRTREVKSQHLHKQKVTSIGRVDDDLCFSAGLDGNVIFWRWQAGRIKESFRLPHGRPVRDANLSEGNRSRSLLITRQGEGTMHRWDLSRLENRFRD